jgi:hypothetical protein
MATTNTTTGLSCVASSVTSLEAAAYHLLKAFNAASSHTQHVILNDFVSASDLHGLSLTVGAATLVEALDAMSATTTNGHDPDRCLSAAADTFDKATVAVIQAIGSTDPATHHAMNFSYQTCDLPHLDQLDPLFAVAALAKAVSNFEPQRRTGPHHRPVGWPPGPVARTPPVRPGPDRREQHRDGNRKQGWPAPRLLRISTGAAADRPPLSRLQHRPTSASPRQPQPVPNPADLPGTTRRRDGACRRGRQRRIYCRGRHRRHRIRRVVRGHDDPRPRCDPVRPSTVPMHLIQSETQWDTRDEFGQRSGQNAHLPPDMKTARKLSLRAVDLR